MGIFSKKKKSGPPAVVIPGAESAGAEGALAEVDAVDGGPVECRCPAQCVIAPLDQDHPHWAAWLEKARALEADGVAFAPFEGRAEPRRL